MFVLGIKSNPKYAFQWLHRELVLKHFGAFLGITRTHWNITTQPVQTKDFIFSKAKGRDHIPWGSQYTSAGSTVFVCGWSKGIHCPWMEIFVVESPARYTEHFKYLNRCFLEGSTATIVSKQSYSLPHESRLSYWVAEFCKVLLFYLCWFNFRVMPFHQILV